MIEKASRSAADMVFLDLEDAVVPSRKVEARQNVVDALTTLDWGEKVVGVRVNDAAGPWAFDDLLALISAETSRLDVVILPKVRSGRDVEFVSRLLDQLERRAGKPVGSVGVEVLIEEVEALNRMDEIAVSSERLEALILGRGDLAASQAMREQLCPPGMGDVWQYARSGLIVAARAHGLDPIDGPYVDFRDAEGCAREASWVAALGAAGKWAIHPSQISVLNDVFSPTEVEIREALDAVAAATRAANDGVGALSIDGDMADAATTRQHELTLERARRCGLL
jgi:citrate lyase subunit beta / citryl-CoA lyase